MRLHAHGAVSLFITVALGCGNGGGGSSSGGNQPAGPSAITIGQPANVQFAAVTGNAETGASSLALNVATAGTYQCTAHAQQGAQSLDAQLAIFNGTTEVGRDSDSGEGVDALLSTQLQPGNYTVKVWEWMGRAATITVTCTPGPAIPPNPSSVAVGTPATVNVVAGEGPGSQVDLALGIAAAGRVECRAHAAGPDGGGLDAQMKILQGANELAADSDSGGNFDALIARDFTPGAYIVRVWEWQHRAAAITVTCNPAAGIAQAGALALGTPSTVNVAAADGPAGQAEFDLNIEGEGSYQCRAHAAGPDGSGLDGQMAILQNGAELASDSDSGGNYDALITRDLTAGQYKVRVWEWQHRAAAITVTCGLAPPPG